MANGSLLKCSCSNPLVCVCLFHWKKVETKGILTSPIIQGKVLSSRAKQWTSALTRWKIWIVFHSSSQKKKKNSLLTSLLKMWKSYKSCKKILKVEDDQLYSKRSIFKYSISCFSTRLTLKHLSLKKDSPCKNILL